MQNHSHAKHKNEPFILEKYTQFKPTGRELISTSATHTQSLYLHPKWNKKLTSTRPQEQSLRLHRTGLLNHSPTEANHPSSKPLRGHYLGQSTRTQTRTHAQVQTCTSLKMDNLVSTTKFCHCQYFSTSVKVQIFNQQNIFYNRVKKTFFFIAKVSLTKAHNEKIPTFYYMQISLHQNGLSFSPVSCGQNGKE